MKVRKIVSLLIVMVLLFSAFSIVNAATTGSITITKYNTGKVDSGNDPAYEVLPGVTFQLYAVSADETSTAIPSGTNPLQELVTGTNGQVVFSNLPEGRYLVVESNAPANVTDRVSNFLVDIPMTSEDGLTNVYDVVVNPKNDTVYGEYTLTVTDKETTNPIPNVEYKLQVKGTGDTWTDYPVPQDVSLVSGADGKVTVTGLPKGTYRLVEVSVPAGYVLDNETTYEFEVSKVAGTGAAGKASETDINQAQTLTNPDSGSYTKLKPSITNVVTGVTRTNESGRYYPVASGETVSAATGDKISFAATSTVPETIEDMATYTTGIVLDSGLAPVANSVKVYVNDTEMDSSKYTVTENADGYLVTITDKTGLTDTDKIKVTYDATLTASNPGTYRSVATLTYSNAVISGVDGTNTTTTAVSVASAPIATGSLTVTKAAENESGTRLPNAEFKLASSQANASAGNYIKDASGAEIVLTTNASGTATANGLEYGTYYLVETKAPTYQDTDGSTKSYKLLTSATTVVISAANPNASATVINSKGTTLPLTGGIGALIFIILGLLFVIIGINIFKKDKKEAE